MKVVEKGKHQKLKIGADFGIISYNETPLKKVVENGITAISTDFDAMGKQSNSHYQANRLYNHSDG